MLLKETCKTCKKPIKSVQTELPHGKFITYVWNCGHTETMPKIAIAAIPDTKPKYNADALNWIVPEPTQKELYEDLDRWVSDGGPVRILPEVQAILDKEYLMRQPIWHSIDNSGKHAYEYQFDGVHFVEKTGLKALIADAMGVGKTVEALMCIKRNAAIVTPTLIIVKGATVFQWANEYKTWVSRNIGGIMPIMTRDHIIPGFSSYVISMDFLSRKGVLEKLALLGIKCVIVDEVQSFKDNDSKRTKALIQLITDNKIEYRLFLSGTPIKNKVSEYFTVLNLIDPRNFYSMAEFKRQWLTCNEKGVYTKLNPYYEDKFKELTGKYIIRREKHDVLKDLPPLTRDFQLIEIEDEGIKKSYNHALGLFNSFLKNDIEEITSQQLLGWLARLRAITGMAKSQYAVEWINEFLDSSDDSIAIGIHHDNVRETLYNVFQANDLNPLSLSGKDDMYAKDRIVRKFNEGNNRILVINALAGGVGLNLQSCANALVLERQWNSADEEQFEARFHRDGQKKGVTITYMIAKGTIDEFFHDMVYQKRNILAATGIGAVSDEEHSLTSLKEFAEFVASNRI